ncbi:hypothetical protein Bra3105_11105 [Brachybacterium halotolerans subsp. kimchii]|uniref:hypothetical protein n=1 Tax=Brachybacterium halotolerans TaxID=2795215 RepID=UPI001E55FD1F|nr:hypothetical protein [Brachybacterium halotolerans]UEJ81390.1 hypothetical protein Bra3105_11105 [Brachybacterium halotolerans subsp. kimchii]
MADFLRGSAVPLEASGPTLDEQIDQLAAFGLELHHDCDRSMLARAVARGVTPEDLGDGGSGARSIPPHRRACFWWLLCEDVGGVPALQRRMRVDLDGLAFAAGYIDTDDLPLVEQLALIRRTAHRLRDSVPAVHPIHLAVLSADDATRPRGPREPASADALEPTIGGPPCRVRLGDAVVDWTEKDLRSRLAEALRAILPADLRLVMYREVVVDAPDHCLVVPAAHEAAVRGLLLEVLPPALRAGGEWMERVEQHSTSEQVPFTLGAPRMTAGLAVSSVDVPAWTGVHPPMALADQLENMRRVGLVPWTDDIAERLPVRRPSRVPRMCDRPYHDVLATPAGVGHRGLLRGIVHLQERIPDDGRAVRLATSLTSGVRAMADAARPGLAVPRVGLTSIGPRRVEATAVVDGQEISAPVELRGARRPWWDGGAFFDGVAAVLRDPAQRWVTVRPGSRGEPLIAALVAIWHVDEIEEMARTAFGERGRHAAAAAQERAWCEWSDRTNAHDLMLSMSSSDRLAVLESCGISLCDGSDRGLAEHAAESSTWAGLLNTAHRGHRSVFGHVCVWSAQEIADQSVEGLPVAARKVARSVGRDDVELRITGTEDGPRAVVLDAAVTTVQLMDHLPAPGEICHLIGDIADHVSPPGRELVTLGETRLWPLESRAAELRMLLSGG